MKKRTINNEMNNMGGLSDISTEKGKYWIMFRNEKGTKKEVGTLGKYLYFSDNKQSLISLAKKLLIRYGLPSAKVPKSDIPNNSHGFGFVLCVYSYDDTLKHELKQYENEGINYRYYKMNIDTMSGKYSRQYLTG